MTALDVIIEGRCGYALLLHGKVEYRMNYICCREGADEVECARLRLQAMPDGTGLWPFAMKIPKTPKHELARWRVPGHQLRA